jgi:hypothetical protein
VAARKIEIKRKEKIMTGKYMPRLVLMALITAAMLSGGCARHQSLYYWGDYQPQVHEYLKGQGKSHTEQIIALEKIIEEAKSENKPVPPGFHAHLGMLQAAEGKLDLAQLEFQAEKSHFPESTVFMDFLLAKMNGDKK